jgi:tetratricopeptide (TPR) repeat protein
MKDSSRFQSRPGGIFPVLAAMALILSLCAGESCKKNNQASQQAAAQQAATAENQKKAAEIVRQSSSLKGAEAVKALDGAIQLDPRSAGAYAARGRAFFETSQYPKAVSDLTQAILLDDKNGEAFFLRGIVQLEYTFDSKNALKDFARVKELAKGGGTTRLAEGILLASEGKADDAMKAFDKAASGSEIACYAYIERGRLNWQQGKINDAVVDFDSAINNAKDNPLPYCWHSAGQFKKGLKDAETAISKGQGFSFAYAVRAAAHLLTPDLDKALADASKAIELAPAPPLAYIVRARVLAERKEPDKAIADLSTALDIEADNAMALYDRGKVFYSLANAYRADKDWEKWKSVAAADFGALTKEQKEELEGVKKLVKLEEFEPGTETRLYDRAGEYLKMKCYDKAEKDYDKILSLNAKSWLAHYNLACICSLNKRVDEAFEHLEKSMEQGYGRMPDHWAWIEKGDTDLINMRSDPRFATLLDKYKKIWAAEKPAEEKKPDEKPPGGAGS